MFSYKGITNELSVNVSLDYHAGGVRVEEIGSSEGLGWALNAGGIITRTMRGQPDDLPTYGYMALYPDLPPGTDPFTDQNIDNVFLQNGEDSEQDLFSFSFDGHSGRFVLDGHGNPILVDQDNLKIQPIRPNDSFGYPFLGFIITDVNGVKYIFSDAETSFINISPITDPNWSSSWYLSQIATPFSTDTIKFFYNTTPNNYISLGVDSKMNQLIFPTGASQTATTTTSQNNSYMVLAKKIKQIQLPDNETVDFFYAPVTRCDLVGDSILTEVRRTDHTTGKSTGFLLYEDYLDDLGRHIPISPLPCDISTNTSSFTQRLRLDSVVEYGNSTRKPAYVFQYNDAFLLPPMNSKQQDMWGFYNGPLNTSGSLVPRYLFRDASAGTSYWLDGADRDVDSNNIKASSLTQIRYPTGGTTSFNFEANRIGDPDLVTTTTMVDNYAILNFRNIDSGYTTFTLAKDQPNEVLSFDFFQGARCPGVSSLCVYQYSIESADGSTLYTSETFNVNEVGTTKTMTLNLPNGQYRFAWGYSGGGTDCGPCDETFNATLHWQTLQVNTSVLGNYAGGLRIASTVDYDGIDHRNDVVRTYSYLDNSGRCSGTVGMKPTYGYNFANCSSFDGGNGSTGTTVFDYLVRLGTTNVPLCYTQGSPVGYAQVEVAVTSGSVNHGREVDYFTSYNDAPVNQSTSIPFVPAETWDWELGLLTRQEIYNGTGQILRKVVNAYVPILGFLDSLTNFKMGQTQVNNCGTGLTSPFSTQFVDQSYFWRVGHTLKTSTTETSYTPAGDSLTTQVLFQYDPVYFTNVTQETRVNSKGDTEVIDHYYPTNYSMAGSALGDMVDSNMVGIRVSNENWRRLNGSYYLTGANVLNYTRFSGGILPATFYQLNSSQPVAQSTIGSFNPTQLLRSPSLYYTDVTFEGYDGKGNATQVVEKGTRTNYIWDLNGEYPVARVVGADNVSIAYTSFEADGTGGWSLAPGSVDGSGGVTGSHCYILNGAITHANLNASNSYIVTYWARNGSGPYNIPGTVAGYPIQGRSVTLNGVTWTYYEHKITGQGTIAVNVNGAIDELRLFPAGAQMTSYTYSASLGMTSQCDAAGRIVYYEYDDLNRLKDSRDLDGNVIKTYQYNYKR